jgi:hypothetical protein
MGHWPAFRAALALSRQPRANLYALFQGWIDTLLALSAARLVGSWRPATSPDQVVARREALRQCEALDAEMARVRATAAKEKQMARQVELNLALRRLEADKKAALDRL